MKYLVIENQGQIEPNAFALMGASTKRGDEGKIGMFGTGSKYALAVLLENSIEPTVLSGDLKIRFGLQKAALKDKEYKQVVMRIGRKETPLSFTTSMGLHWGIAQALRELISNALDEGGLVVSVRDGVIAKDGVTRIMIPFEHQDVIKFYAELKTWFSMGRTPVETTTGFWRGEAKLYERAGAGVRVYRRGVLVFSAADIEAAFDYDLPWVDVREDRTADKWNVMSAVGDVLDAVSLSSKKRVMQTVRQHQDKCLEGICSVQYSVRSKDWAEVLDGKHVATAALASAHRGEIAANASVQVLPEAWAKALTTEAVGCSSAADLLTTAKLKGYTESEVCLASDQKLEMFTGCLSLLEQAGVYSPDNAPTFRVFSSAQKDAPWGEYVKKEDKVLVNETVFSFGKRQVFETLTEELMHRKTGYEDNTRQFQTAIFRELTDVFCRTTGVIL